MTYQIPHGIAVLSFIEDGSSKVEAARIFKVSRETIYRWLALDDIAPKPPLKIRHRKIDKDKLRTHVCQDLDMFLRERAAHFDVKISSMSVALRKLGIVKKKEHKYSDRCNMKRQGFLQRLRKLIKEYGSDNVVYFDKMALSLMKIALVGGPCVAQKFTGMCVVNGKNGPIF